MLRRSSPFMRNIEVVIALLFGYFIAFLTRHNGQKYVTTANFDVAPVVTFIWKKWFGIGFYTPALLRAPPCHPVHPPSLPEALRGPQPCT